MLINWSISLDPSETEGVIKVPDNATDDEITETVREIAFNWLDWGWAVCKPKDCEKCSYPAWRRCGGYEKAIQEVDEYVD